ncbi:MAG TPA: molybdopterin-dependent oxidoreductase, partial [Anaerolineaceae bacterium]|nr:molybdopterin-dependent oxidoreductase [Anaerolineaceae bacterium]
MSLKVTRRDLLKLTGVGAAAAVLTGCGPAARYVTRRPYPHMPEYNQTGLSTYYATACRECPAGCGLIVRTKEGRALQAAGNPDHPVNQGKICPRGLTAVQGLYQPERIKAPRRQYRGKGDFAALTWEEAIPEVAAGLKKGSKAAFLLGMTSDHLYDLVSELGAAAGAQVLRYGALNLFEGRTTLAKAAESVFGVAGVPYFDLSKADVIFSFGANFLETWVSPLAYARGYSQMRRGKFDKRGYLVVFEPRQSMTAASADEWVPVVPGTEGIVAQAIGALIERRSPKAVAPLYADVDIAEAARVSGVAEEKL